MTDEEKKPPTPEDLQKQLKDFFKDKFGGQVFFHPMGAQAPMPAGEEAGTEEERHIDFDMNPREVKEYLDRFVIGQEEGKEVLSVAVCDHFNHIRCVLENPEESEEEYVKQNVILLGPTGVGKTYLVRTLAQLIGVPFVKADITKFSETGYVGGDVDDLVRELVRMADGDLSLAECGIIFLDEIDKIAASAEPIGRDVSGRGVQTGLLKLLEETEVPTRSPFDMAAQLRDMMQTSRGGRAKKNTINTKHILFVVSGAFTRLTDIIAKRLTATKVGFSAPAREEDPEAMLMQVTTGDFIEYGLEPEFIGRLPIRVALNALTEEDLFNILKNSEGSIIRQYRRNFEAFGIDVAFLDDGLKAVAERALPEATGARGLMTILESVLRKFKFHLPGRNVKRFAVTRELIENPGELLDRLLKDPDHGLKPFLGAQVREFEDRFLKEHGIRIVFDDTGLKRAVAMAEEQDRSIHDLLDALLMDYVYGLRIIREHTGAETFTLTTENLDKPRDILDAWVKDALNK